jgi:pimeloyl-ACP methyl ester carboxylesterase
MSVLRRLGRLLPRIALAFLLGTFVRNGVASEQPPTTRAATGLAADVGPTDPAFPGTRSKWNGFDRYDFSCDGKPAIVVVPSKAAAGNPWLWRGEFFGAFPSVDKALLAAGWHVAHLGCPNTFGSPDTMKHWEAFYGELTARHALSAKPVMYGMSRGGLYVYHWAALHPDKVGLIYGDAPVCDVKSWPGGKGRGKGSKGDWELFKKVYGLTEEQAVAWTGNPIDELAPIAKGKVPILHVVGDADDAVPVEENTSIVQRRYEAFGGRFELIVKKGVGHHPHSLEDPTPIVNFILRNAIGLEPKALAAP